MAPGSVAVRFPPGVSGNPAGRPKGIKTLKAMLREALQALPDETGKEMLEHIIQEFKSDNKVLVALLPYLLDNVGDVKPTGQTVNILSLIQQSNGNGAVAEILEYTRNMTLGPAEEGSVGESPGESG